MSNEWGQLKGVRPVKLIRYLQEKYCNEKDIEATLLKEYRLSKDNIDLLMGIAKIEDQAIAPIVSKENNIALYINIPFCPSRCTYCSFITIGNSKSHELKNQYLRALLKELNAVLEYASKANKNISLIYIGGGTPTVFEAKSLVKILYEISKHNNKTCEFTVEAGRVDTINDEKFGVLNEYGVNRVSVNPQTLSMETLKKVNRNHSIEQIYKANELAKIYNFIINMDLILGLPDEGLREVQNTVKGIIELSPHNITVHNLALKRTSHLNQGKVFTNADKVVISSMNEFSNAELIKKDYYPYYLYRQKNTTGGYPNIGYTKKGYECLYNIAMISELCTIYGCGAGSITKVLDKEKRFERFSTPKDAVTYIKNIDSIVDKKIRWFKNEDRK